MTLLEEAKKHMQDMREHEHCCGMPIFRRMVAELERMQSALALVNGWDTGTDATEQP